MFVSCDFHNHSCLSPCGSLELSPRELAKTAKERGLGLVAITDHNTSLNAPAFSKCAKEYGINALFGMEATTFEEVHVLCLFSDLESTMEFNNFIDKHLPFMKYDPEKMGDEVVVDEEDNVLDLCEKYFGIALDLPFCDLCEEAVAHGAVVIPAHIDRPMFGAISQLGFLPLGPYSAVEVMRPVQNGENRDYPIVTGSDSHYIEQIARRPFALDLPQDWNADGKVNLKYIKDALESNKIRLPFR